MAKRLNSALANIWGLSQIKRRMKTLWHVLFHNLAAAETSDSSHVCENSLPVLSVCYCTLRRWFYGLDCRAVFLFVVFALRTIQTARQMQPELISFGNRVAKRMCNKLEKRLVCHGHQFLPLGGGDGSLD